MNPFRFNVFRLDAADKESNYFAFFFLQIFFYFYKMGKKARYILAYDGITCNKFYSHSIRNVNGNG